MRRLVIILSITTAVVAVLVISLMIMIPPLAAEQDAQATAPPTNTARPTIPPTNTPRFTPTPLISDTPTITPSLTPSATLTPSPSFTPTASFTPTITNTPTFTPSPTVTVVGPREYPDNFNPLTGLPYPDEESRIRRSAIVKVSNFPEVVRPQSGLMKADIVFEYEVEGGVTRFAAIYRSQGSEHVGSIRSARLLDLELVEMFDGLLAYSGSNEWIRQYILDSEWKWRALSPHLGVNCPPFCRFEEEGKAFEHTLFGNVYQMWDEAERRQVGEGFQFKGLAFSYVPPVGGEVVNDIFIDSYNDRQDTRWQYNPDDGRYYRWNTGLPHYDAETNEQINTDNVVILEAEHIPRPEIYESETGGTVLETVLWGRGTAWLFRDGKWWQGEWWHSQGKIGLYLMFADGETPMHLKPGQTWFEIVRPFMWGVETSIEPANMPATEQAIYAAQTASHEQTMTAIAPWVTATPIPPTPTTVGVP
ncbi:MAG: DUF3048 domain-containing protein [Anaerolineae bacterium]|nr:DUF3048 domain-containing protein [Anaerolineae bacterium]